MEKWKTFKEFFNCSFGYWKITLDKNSSECFKLVLFFKGYICKHSIGICILLKKVENQMPLADINVEIGQ